MCNAKRQPQAGETDRQVDQKDRTPAEERDQRAANQGTRSQREARARGPDGNRAALSS